MFKNRPVWVDYLLILLGAFIMGFAIKNMYLAMENIIEQKDLARKMGVNAVRVRQLYKFDTIIDMWEKVMLLKEK